jgi:hypothetical protein
MITRTKLATMKEKELQRDVLVPLFEAWGFRDVEVHQGTTEAGKDLVMWRLGDLGERLNYAVVVKAKPISGKAAGKSSAAEVRFQIEQAFSSEWYDSKTTQVQRADRCFVICSKEIKKEAISAIQGVLNASNLDKITRFIDGDELWDLVQQHTPERAVFAKLEELQQTLDAASPDYKLVAKTTGELIIEPKSPEKLPAQPLLRVIVDFPDTEEGKEAKEEYDQQLSTGEPAVIASPYLSRLEMADFLIPFVGQISPDQTKLVVLPLEIGPTGVELSIELADGSNIKLDLVELKGFRGNEILTLHNQHQSVPYKLKMVVDFKNKRIDWSFGIEHGVHNVKPKLDALRFWMALAAGGTLSISHRDTGLLIAKQSVIPGSIPLQDPILVEIFEKLTSIQLKTRQPINAPSKFSRKVIEEIFSTFVKVDTGKGLYRTDKITFPGNVQLASNLLKYLGNSETGNLFYNTMSEQTVRLFDTEINLGNAVFLMEKVSLDPHEAARLKSELAEAGSEATFEIPITIVDKLIRVWYPKWLPEEQQRSLPILDEGDLGSL